MRQLIDNDYLTMLSRLLIGGMFISASFYKIIEPADFAKSIWQYHMIPGSLINLMALILPWLELLIGLALIFGFAYRGAILWANMLLGVFIIALISTIARGLDIDCGCFKAGESATAPAWDALWFDLVAMFFAVQLWIGKSSRWRFRLDLINRGCGG
ncbi:MAG: DoxX family membrane protein [candidate division Zixibacteria bacterium]|nr:DoxX family membrane protein [candidate division Zixibacteria bacterium]